MAEEQEEEQQNQAEELKKLVSSFLGLSFSVFLTLLPKNSIFLVPTLKSQERELSIKLFQAEEQLRQMKSRRKEDSKANVRVVEIFASHRNAWHAEENRLLHQIDAATEEIAHLKTKVTDFEKYEAESEARIEELEREVFERDEMITFMSRRDNGESEAEKAEQELVGAQSGEWFQKDVEECMLGTNRNVEEINIVYEHGQQYQQQLCNGFDLEKLATASKLLAEKATLWQDVQYESLESLYNTKLFIARRESPWKVDSESTEDSSKLKLLELELLNLENVGKSDPSKVPPLMRKQARRYQTLAGKINNLCRRMASDPCELNLSSEFQTQRQTDFLLEAFRLQQRTSDTGQKLAALQTEIGKNYNKDELGSQGLLPPRRSLDSIRNNFKGIQRNLEIWLARIIGDVEGILARDGTSRVKDCYISRYPIAQ